MRRLLPAALVLVLSACAQSGSSGGHPAMNAPMASTGSGIDPNLFATPAEPEPAKPTDFSKTGQLETKVVTADPKDSKTMAELASCLLASEWILVRKEPKSDGVNVYTFIRPASTRVGLDGVGKPDVSKRNEDGDFVPVPAPTPAPK